MKRHARAPSPVDAGTKRRGKVRRVARERVLLEFPSDLLERADTAAGAMQTSRSGLVRSAVEGFLRGLEREKLEAELAIAYAANSAMNVEIARDFKHVDDEGF